MYQIYRVPTHRLGSSDQPDFMLREGLFFPTINHPDGWSEDPIYQLGPDGRIYRCSRHPPGAGNQPDFEIGPDCLMYRTVYHPKGHSAAPQYEIRKMAR